MKEVPLTKGMVAVVDDEDFEAVMQFKWCATVSNTHRKFRRNCTPKYYACRFERQPDGKRKKVYLHRWLMGDPPGLIVDHMDGNGLNCSRATNLRITDAAGNRANIHGSILEETEEVEWN